MAEKPIEYTNDEWEKVKSPLGGWVIQGKNTGILICREIRHYNADYICLLHNTLRGINPSNPMAVAEGMGEVIRICKRLAKTVDSRISGAQEQKMPETNDVIKLQQALAKITGGK